MTDSELRRDTRYTVQLSCRVSSPLQSFNELSGVTLNMSRSGLLAVFGEAGGPVPPPIIGTPVRITVELPGAPGKSPRFLECLGRVARVGDDSSLRQVGFILQRYLFQAGEGSASHDSASGPAYDSVH